MSVYIKNKEIYINGKPTIILSGEIHYFRLKQCEWQKRIDNLKSAGLNTVATYIPWICHEEEENSFDFEGKTHEELDLIKFMNMVKDSGLYFIARPGPFVMAEMKNDGIPFWVREKYPHIIPTTWDGKEATTVTLDYLDKDFLRLSKLWYSKIINLLKDYSISNGGNLIACQLDNEIGMLSWVSNNPDLTDTVLEDFKKYLVDKYETVKDRYSFIHEDFKDYITSPQESYVASLHYDLGEYMRLRTLKYVNYLREYAIEYGLTNIPFLINIHGTGGGRAFTYPIGISQLYRSYNYDNSFISGSDIYFDDLTIPRLADNYITNIFTDCVNNNDQPLTSLEFNVGDNNFGNDFGGRVKASTNNLRNRLFIAQGNKMLNYYLFCGGTNYRFKKKIYDGNDRIASTGEEHGYAAPIGPKGDKSYVYDKFSMSTKLISAFNDKLATSFIEKDAISFAFIPDYYMTEFRYPKSKKMQEMHNNISQNRSGYAWDGVCRAMLLLNYQFDAINIQDNDIDIDHTKVLVLPSSRYMSKDIQQKIVSYLHKGGKVLLYGEVPLYDLEGNECNILCKELGLTFKNIITRQHLKYIPSVECTSFLSDLVDYHIHYNLSYELSKGTSIMQMYDTRESVGFEINVGLGSLIGITCQYPCNLEVYKKIFNRLGILNKLSHDYNNHGLFIATTINNNRERFLHVLNLDDVKKEFNVFENKEHLFEGNQLELEENDGLLLPLNVHFNKVLVEYSTNEIIEYDDNSITLRLTGNKLVCKLKTQYKIKQGNFNLIYENDSIYIIKETRFYNENELKIEFV